MIKVSIIVPIYNVSKYIIRCIDSVINQTYTDIECILVDDCTPDDSMVLAEQRLESYTGTIDFKIIHHEKNKGLSGARNTGTLHATGEYLYYLDSDDEILPSCIKLLTDLVEKYPNVEMVQGNTQTIPQPAKEQDWRNISYKGYPEYVDDNLWIREHFLSIPMNSIPVNAWNKLVKRDFILQYNLFFKEGIIHEDEQWMFFTVKRLNAIAFITEYSYIHYITEGSIMQSDDNYNSIRSWNIILQDFFENFDSNFCESQKKKYIAVLFRKMRQINLKSKESELYPNYITLIKNLIAKRKIYNWNMLSLFLLNVLLLPQIFYKSLIGCKLFSIGLKFMWKL